MSNERSDLGRLIWETSQRDEGTISVTGANIVADAILAAGYRKPRTVGYVAVGTGSNGLDWDEAVYESEDAVIDSLCGPYQPFSRAPESPDYWGREYRICAITELHEAPND